MSTLLPAKFREAFTALLGDHAAYVGLKPETKEPSGSYRLTGKRKPKARVDTIPESGNYGVLPVKGFFILDLDVHRGDLQETVEFFSDFLGVDLYSTLHVRTPSGGLHFYLRIPEEQTIFNGSLRSYTKKLAEMLEREVPTLDADVRSADAPGYVVGPGSNVSLSRDGAPYATPGGYELLGDSLNLIATEDFESIPLISHKALTVLSELRTLQKSKARPQTSKGVERDENIPLIEGKLDYKTYEKIRTGLQLKLGAEPELEFHRQRAFLSGALRCCFSDFAIAAAVVELELHKDSYSGRKFSFWQIVSDLHRLRENKATNYHTSYCPLGRPKRESTSSKPKRDYVAENKKKIAERSFARNNGRRVVQVVHIPKAMTRLRLHDSRKKLSQVKLDALMLLDVLFQPLLNVGASRVVIAVAPVARDLGISSSRLSAATRLLRENKIVEIKNRQKTGLATTYVVAENFIHKPLTSAIRHRWGQLLDKGNGEDASLVYDRFNSGFVNLKTGELHELGFEVVKPERPELLKEHPLAYDFVRRYMHQELENDGVSPRLIQAREKALAEASALEVA